jgi:hypothetical protein
LFFSFISFWWEAVHTFAFCGHKSINIPQANNVHGNPIALTPGYCHLYLQTETENKKRCGQYVHLRTKAQSEDPLINERPDMRVHFPTFAFRVHSERTDQTTSASRPISSLASFSYKQ